MACATLKRNLDWESMSQMPAKRRRCAPYTPSTSPGLKVSENKVSPFGDAVTSQAKLTPERMAQEICDEIKRLQRRRQLRMLGEGSAGGAGPSSSSGSEGDASPPHRAPPHKAHNKALFTFKQVRQICERMLGEQEAALRAEYEAALSAKLAEQYEAFVRFNLDQIQRRPPPSHHHMEAEASSHLHPHAMQHELVPSYLS